jgi:transposase
MKYIKGQTREQTFLFPVSMDASISKENEVRVIDLFVESLNLKDFGFKVDFVENGRPAYHPSDLLKLYIYGYMNKIRSSRDLEKECKRNIEVMWLLKSLQPDHNTIAIFRKDNSEAIRKVFESTVKIAKHFNLLGKKLIAGDSTKLRAQNSKKNNYNQGKINRHIEYIDRKIEEYNSALSKEDCDKPEELKKAIEKHLTRKEEYRKLEKQLNESGQDQISTSDTESRQMITRNNITEVAYNVQTTVDAENCLLIDYKVTNNNDSKAMGEMVTRAAEIIENTDFTALYDKGYHKGTELKTAQDLGVKTLVAIPDPTSNAPDPKYNIANFIYNKEENTYTCPEGHTLKTNGTWYNKSQGKNRSDTKIQHFKTKECQHCPAKSMCTKNKDGKVLERSEYADNIEQNRINIESNPDLYKRRQSIVEHPYGTIKRQWGFSYIMTKHSMKHASADVGFMFIAYNLRRIMNILGNDGLKEYLRTLVTTFLAFICFDYSRNNNKNNWLEQFCFKFEF